jgi:FkbM family methyltransferase
VTDNPQYILFGAGATGRFVTRDMIATGNPPVAIADNDPKKYGTKFEGIKILSPTAARHSFPDAEWIAAVMDPKFEAELTAQIAALGVKTSSFWDFIPNRDAEIPPAAFQTIKNIAGDVDTTNELLDQQRFRRHRDHKRQIPAMPIEELYFPDFIEKLDEEVYLDAGAADGDSIRAFISRWPRYFGIFAFEPDPANAEKLSKATWDIQKVFRSQSALSDHLHKTSFAAVGDCSSHIGVGGIEVQCITLDYFRTNSDINPTFIKMDIEGEELNALWGARNLIRKHSPVLAICAYHTADHLWEIPLLIHALQPAYKLFLRRYRPGSWEHVWYAVPPERIVK